MSRNIKTTNNTFFLLFSLSFLISLALGSCQSDEKKDVSISSEMVEDTPPDFQDFYIQFHTDSGYQMEHILFPLDGTPAAEQQNDGDFRWTREEWKMHSMDHFDPGQFTVRRDIVDSTLITEYIRDKNSGFGIKRRFAKFDEEWFLIYYSAMNPDAQD